MRTLAVAIALAVTGTAAQAARPKVKARDDWFRVSAASKSPRKRAASRDADWKRLGRLLVSDVVPESEKRKWTVEFLVAYWGSPGIERDMARHLVQHVPRCKMRDALRALAHGEKWKPDAKTSGGLPGFAETVGGAAPPKPEPPREDPLEALLIAKAKEYDAKRADVQQKQLAALQGTSQEDPAQIRRQLTALAPLQNEFCKLSGQYAEKFGTLALKGVLQRERLLEPLDAARCP